VITQLDFPVREEIPGSFEVIRLMKLYFRFQETDKRILISKKPFLPPFFDPDAKLTKLEPKSMDDWVEVLLHALKQTGTAVKAKDMLLPVPKLQYLFQNRFKNPHGLLKNGLEKKEIETLKLTGSVYVQLKHVIIPDFTEKLEIGENLNLLKQASKVKTKKTPAGLGAAPPTKRLKFTICVMNLPPNCSESLIRRFFASEGVVAVRMGKTRAFVDVRDQHGLNNALKRDGEKMEGSPLSIKDDNKPEGMVVVKKNNASNKNGPKKVNNGSNSNSNNKGNEDVQKKEKLKVEVLESNVAPVVQVVKQEYKVDKSIWICEICEQENDLKRTVCEVCLMER
jgi:hypothetical protein